MRSLILSSILSLILVGCSGIQSKPTAVAGEASSPRPEPLPPPPPPIVEAAPPRIEAKEAEKVDSGPIFYERVVYAMGRGQVRPTASAASSAVVSASAPVMGVCATCPGCPSCNPVVNVTPPTEKNEGPWGFIAAAFGGAASVLAAAFAKKYLGVSA